MISLLTAAFWPATALAVFVLAIKFADRLLNHLAVKAKHSLELDALKTKVQDIDTKLTRVSNEKALIPRQRGSL